MPNFEILVMRFELLGSEPETGLHILELSRVLTAEFGIRILRVLGEFLLHIGHSAMVFLNENNKILHDFLLEEELGIKLL